MTTRMSGRPALLKSVARDGCPLGIDVSERAGNLVVHVNLGGIKPRCVNVTAVDGVLTISGQREEVRDEDFLHCAHETRVFRRAVRLPKGARADRIKTSERNGVLRVAVPMGNSRAT